MRRAGRSGMGRVGGSGMGRVGGSGMGRVGGSGMGRVGGSGMPRAGGSGMRRAGSSRKGVLRAAGARLPCTGAGIAEAVVVEPAHRGPARVVERRRTGPVMCHDARAQAVRLGRSGRRIVGTAAVRLGRSGRAVREAAGRCGFGGGRPRAARLLALPLPCGVLRARGSPGHVLGTGASLRAGAPVLAHPSHGARRTSIPPAGPARARRAAGTR
ncbi:hypothetical protein GCM10023215_60280 [Pseudonocardia yuanmonensis]|uniref:Uncharacterized protein n=1 Tax=Pseudonocardia yuanmonensis TaxID=1095914 RepID=A0ABP8XPS7_9PSEU